MILVVLGTAFVVVLGMLMLFQVALAAGAPWGRFAWGGQQEGRLPRNLRIASALSIIIYGCIATVALDRAGVIALFPPAFSRTAMWVIFAFLCLGTLMNLISRSKAERSTMTPVGAVLALLALGIALGFGAVQEYSGVVLGTAEGAGLCHGPVAESAPPQCATRELIGWDWNAVEYIDSGGTRWGDYTFTGIRHGAQIEVIELVAP